MEEEHEEVYLIGSVNSASSTHPKRGRTTTDFCNFKSDSEETTL